MNMILQLCGAVLPTGDDLSAAGRGILFSESIHSIQVHF